MRVEESSGFFFSRSGFIATRSFRVRQDNEHEDIFHSRCVVTWTYILVERKFPRERHTRYGGEKENKIRAKVDDNKSADDFSP